MYQNTVIPIKSIILILVVFVIGIVALVLWTNMDNHRVQAGFAGYNYTKPIMGKNEFQKVLVGPNATGIDRKSVV